METWLPAIPMLRMLVTNRRPLVVARRGVIVALRGDRLTIRCIVDVVVIILRFTMAVALVAGVAR